MAREPSLHANLARAGFTRSARAVELFEDPAFARLFESAGYPTDNHKKWMGELFARVANPDQALLALHQLSHAARAQHSDALMLALQCRAEMLLRLLGSSRMLADWLTTNPQVLSRWPMPTLGMSAASIRANLLTSVGADPAANVPVATVLAHDAGTDAMRSTYWELMAGLAAEDLSHPLPEQLQPAVSETLADMASAVLETCLALARADVAKEDAATRLAVIAMGKAGARELNYISDVDVLFVVAPAAGQTEHAAIQAGTRLASYAARLCTTAATQPPLWHIDANLRPEGKDGPLVRTVASYEAYYTRWAKSWEFQALLKARTVAGDIGVGEQFLNAAAPHVWEAAGRDGFVTDAQAMRRRVEAHIKLDEKPWHIKLGVGGLRDVEFTVQLLQLVHGRTDPTLRMRQTEAAISALSAGGYMSREHAQELGEHYRFLRVLEHRCQLNRMRRTHLFPRTEENQVALARGMGLTHNALMERLQLARRRVRVLHELIFYRPLLPAVAQLSAEDVSLSPDRAAARLEAMGFLDAAGALRHIDALTRGLSRRAAIQRQLLPAMLGWFALGPDPDGGLLAFRNLSEKLGATHWYLKLLRDSPAAAEYLAKVLSHSNYASEKLGVSPVAISWLDSDVELQALESGALSQQVDAILHRHSGAGEAAQALRALRRRELTRAALKDVIHGVSHTTCRSSISPATDAIIAGVLQLARRQAAIDLELTEEPGEFLVISMGRLGGSEIGYSSDADVMYVYRPTAVPPEPVPHAGNAPNTNAAADKWANHVAVLIGKLLGEAGAEPALEIDVTLRPEGKNGPLVRSFSAYRQYYERWAMGWERQALLRARPIAGSESFSQQFLDLIDPLRYPADGITAAEVTEIRRIKARMEAERLPRGASTATHVKLGSGGLTDVEWTIQLIQLSMGHEHLQLRTTNTLDAISCARELQLISQVQATSLQQAWVLATRIRQANALWSGSLRANRIDVLPQTPKDLTGVAALLGVGGATPGQNLENQWLGVSRKARHVMSQVFYGNL